MAKRVEYTTELLRHALQQLEIMHLILGCEGGFSINGRLLSYEQVYHMAFDIRHRDISRAFILGCFFGPCITGLLQLALGY